ncbi:MAG: ABC transporter substrate-binding protein, partial [Peptostreptococcaceae bacterium]
MKKLLKSIIVSVVVIILSIPTVFADDNSKLVIGVHKDENNITPYTYVTGSPGLDLVNLVYDKLFILNKDNNVIPWMVEEDYKISEDFKTFEFKLVPNQKWHDDKPLTAEDIKFSLEYAKEQKNAKARIIDSVEVKDELSFVITLNESNIDFISDGLTNIFIVPKHIYEKYEKAEEVKETIGSGIYKLNEYKVGEYYKFEANSEYFKGGVNPKEIYMPIITDSTAMFQAIKSGEIAATTMGLSPELLETFTSDENIEILNSPGF